MTPAGRVVVLEIVASSVDGVREAIAGGADRIELCSNIVEGGVTPSAGLIEEATDLGRLAGIPIMVMIRPRGGDFVYDSAERHVMLADIKIARRIGRTGFVVGGLTTDGQVDTELTRMLVDATEGREVTFHRAVDTAADPMAAAAAAFGLGCSRVLTSGGVATAAAGAGVIRQIVAAAPAGRSVIAAGGVRPANAAALVEATGVRELHASLRTHASPGRPQMRRVSVGTMPDWPVDSWPVPDRQAVQQLRAAVS